MEARFFPAVVVLILIVSMGASTRTPNFTVDAPTPELADKIGKAAEKYRRDLAIEWLGRPMPNWSKPCPIVAEVAPHLGAGGATSFVFDRGEVFGWDMKIQGNEQRLLDSVLPHEVTHTIFASHFRRPLPRWADEGACTTVEHIAEKSKQQQMLISFLKTNRGIAFHQMFAMKDYPKDVMPLYSQGFSLARFLIEQGGKQKFLEFVGDGLKAEKWSETIKHHYGYENLAVLQDKWLAWVKEGSPKLGDGRADELLASNSRTRASANPLYRAQSEDPSKPKPTEFAALPPLRPVGHSWQESSGGSHVDDRESVYERHDAASSATAENNSSSSPLPASRQTPERLAVLDERTDAAGSKKVLLQWSRPSEEAIRKY
ncbi:MAG: hypothetical protein IT427_11285 [Pirellulales bacterium]|nr:hypothetical protein [Pirellulales bacterium]